MQLTNAMLPHKRRPCTGQGVATVPASQSICRSRHGYDHRKRSLLASTARTQSTSRGRLSQARLSCLTWTLALSPCTKASETKGMASHTLHKTLNCETLHSQNALSFQLMLHASLRIVCLKRLKRHVITWSSQDFTGWGWCRAGLCTQT